MSSQPPAPDPVPRKGRRQISWLLLLAVAPLIPVLSFFFQQRESTDSLPLPPPTPAPTPIVEPELPYVVAMRSTPEPSSIPVPRYYQPIGDVGFSNAQDNSSSESVQESGSNASTHYRSAFLLYAALTDEEKKLLRQPARQVKNASVLFKKIEPMVELLRKAASANFCKWGATEQTYDKPLPHVARALDLGIVAVWSADYRFAKEPEQAMTDLRALAKLTDSLADTLAGWRMQMQVNTLAMRMVRQHTGHFTWNVAIAVQDIFESCHLARNIWPAFQGDLKTADALAQSLNSGSREEQTRALATIQAMVQSVAGRKVDGALEMKMVDAAWLLPEWRYTRTLMQQMAEQMSSSPEEYAEWWANVQKTQLNKDHPLAAATLKGLHTMRPPWEEHQLELAMLCAGLGQYSDEATGSRVRYNDPATSWDFTFTRVKKEGGFELRSAKKVGGQPLTMSFQPRRE